MLIPLLLGSTASLPVLGSLQREWQKGMARHRQAVAHLGEAVRGGQLAVSVHQAGMMTQANSVAAKGTLAIQVSQNVVGTVRKLDSASKQGEPIKQLLSEMKAFERLLKEVPEQFRTDMREKRYSEFASRFQQIKNPAFNSQTVNMADKWSRLRLSINVRIESIKEFFKLAGIKIPVIVAEMIAGLQEASNAGKPVKEMQVLLAEGRLLANEIQDRKARQKFLSRLLDN